MLVVVLSLVLLNFKTSGVACPSGYEYNATTSTSACVEIANNSAVSTGADVTVFSGIDTAVTAFQEPANWVQIVIIAPIGAGIIALFFILFKMKGRSGE